MWATSLFTLLAFASVSHGQLNKYIIESLRMALPTAFLQTGIATLFVSDLVNVEYGSPKTTYNKLKNIRTSKLSPLPARYTKQIPGSKTVKIRHGPYTIPNMNHKNFLQERGSLWNFPDLAIKRPCQHNCVIFGITAGLEYEDGKNANIAWHSDTQAWLHHMVLFNIGAGRVDQTCRGSFSALPHADVGCNPLFCERIFASGNERTPLSMAEHVEPGSKPAGYFLRPMDRFAMIIDLMNDSEKDKNVYLTMTYDYVDGWPQTMDHMRPVWLDVDECGISEVRAKHQTGNYTIKARPWRATMNGEVLGYGGYLHDGGVVVNMEVDGVKDCASYATYGALPEFINEQTASTPLRDVGGGPGKETPETPVKDMSKAMDSLEKGMKSMGGSSGLEKFDILGIARLGRLARSKSFPVVSDLVPDLPDISLDIGGTLGMLRQSRERKQQGSASVHISNQSTCYGDMIKTRQMKKGQKWLLTADYDYNKFKGSLEQDGSQGAVMGIVIMYVRQAWKHGKAAVAGEAAEDAEVVADIQATANATIANGKGIRAAIDRKVAGKEAAAERKAAKGEKAATGKKSATGFRAAMSKKKAARKEASARRKTAAGKESS